MFSSSLPLDGSPQFTLLVLSMGFSAYVVQFLHRLYEKKNFKDRPPLLFALTFFMLTTTVLFVRILLRTWWQFGHLAIDISILTLLFPAHVALIYSAIGFYKGGGDDQ